MIGDGRRRRAIGRSQGDGDRCDLLKLDLSMFE